MSQRDHGIENVMRRNLSPEISDLILYMKAVLAKQWLCLHTILQEHAKANHTPYFFLFVFVIIFLILLICVLKLPTFQGNSMLILSVVQLYVQLWQEVQQVNNRWNLKREGSGNAHLHLSDHAAAQVGGRILCKGKFWSI